MENVRYFIPFNQLKDTLRSYCEDYNKFISSLFPLTVCGKTLYICRQDGTNADQSMWADLLSDCAMELLAEKAKSKLELVNNIGELVVAEDDAELTSKLIDIELEILEHDFEVPFDRDMDKQSIAIGATCFYRESVEYVTFVGVVPSTLVIDGRNAIVRDQNNNLREVHLCDLVPSY